MAKKSEPKAGKQVAALRHKGDKRRNIPTAEHQSVIDKAEEKPREVRYPRNTDLDPQLVWRGKDYQDWTDLVVQAPPLYIQEKIQPKVLIDDLMRQSKAAASQKSEVQIDLFSDFNGIPEGADKTEFYRHDQNWSNRMILGDSLQVMASLAEREGLRGKVQCIYFDPPYGIKFNSNFQWSTTSRDVKDGNAAHITREPEQVKAFRDTWRDGIHSYLTYLRDRLTVARDLLTDSGSIFVQIGDENLYLIKALLSEVFGDDSYVNTIAIKKKGSTLATESMFDFLVWYCRDPGHLKFRRPLALRRSAEEDAKFNTVISPDGQHVRVVDLDREDIALRLEQGWRWSRVNFPIVSQHPHELRSADYPFQGKLRSCGRNRQWSFDNPAGLDRLAFADRLFDGGGDSLGGIVFHEDRQATAIGNLWDDVKGEEDPVYVVQTAWKIVQRCVLMTTDPGDLVLDPTCGSGTSAVIAEKWGRRWITIDTSRVALALARSRVMAELYPFYLLTDSVEGQSKLADLSGRPHTSQQTYGNVRHGFVCERVPHVTLKSIANNVEIDVVYEEHRPTMRAALDALNSALRGHAKPFHVVSGGRQGRDVSFSSPTQAVFKMPSGAAVPASALVEWEVPRDPPSDWPEASRQPLADFRAARVARQKAVDESIAAKAEFEYLHDRPYEDKKTVRVSGPFTVESLSPHRTLGVGADGELIDPATRPGRNAPEGTSFEQMILENLKAAGVQQAEKSARITFDSVEPWPGELICGEGQYHEANAERRVGIFIGPEFGTVGRADLVRAAREAGDAGFDVLIACAFNYEAHASEFSKLGRIPVLKARMNADLHMAGELKATGRGNLFVIFGEPDIDILHDDDDRIRVHVKGVDVFDPGTGEVRSDGPAGIACWFIDTDYNEESFFVRHAYFLGQNDPYSALRTTLKAEINADAWETLHSEVSRPFEKPSSGRIAVKVINHLGDEVMKVFRVE